MRAADPQSRDASPLRRGATIAPGYEVIEHLRRGNDLDVYDAWSTERLARCAIKTVRPDRAHRSRSCESLRREGRLLQRLNHPHIVRAYETVEASAPLVVLETLPGATLSVLIADEPVPAPEELGHLGLQLASGLAYLHRHGHLHLDLKPSNVIAEAGRAKLIDLSVARPPGPAPAGIGTWHYLAPEQARGGALGPAADVWGLGALLFEVATGEAPYDDDPDAWQGLPSNGSETGSEGSRERYPQLERAPRTPEAVRPLPAEVADPIAACLRRDSHQRPTLIELMARFERLAALPASERRWSAGSQSASR